MFRKRLGRKRPSLLRRAGRAIYRGAKRRYFTKGGMGRAMKDIAFVKSVVNAEKKRLDLISGASSLVGQVSGNSTGNVVYDITPVPAEGLTYSTRNGASIKLHTSFIQLQFTQQTACHSAIRLKIMIVQVLGSPQTTGTINSQIMLPNQWIQNQNSVSVYDYMSLVNPDYRGQYKIIRTKYVSIPADNYSGQVRLKDVKIPIKYNRGKGHHVRYAGDTTTVANGQLFMLIYADNGNSLGSASTLTGIANTAASTGLSWNYDIKHYYYDN